MRVRGFAALVPRAGNAPVTVDTTALGKPWRSWQAGALTVVYEPRPGEPGGDAALPPALILGDDAEYEAATPDRNLANGAVILVDAGARALTAFTSIVGLPPIYRYTGAHGTALASDLHLLSRLPGVRLELDPHGVSELARFGHPVEQRTLFRGVELLRAGHRVRLGDDGALALQRSWELPPPAPRPPAEFIEAQSAAFLAAVARIRVDRTFLSLTAGLDTRAVFAALAQAGRLVPAVTMSGPRRSLDARIAARLCEAYGLSHELVTFDKRFRRALPDLMERSSLLSGGLTGFSQAPEIFLYERVGAGYAARLSGNLGNQVGRGGTEGVSVRDADTAILTPALRHRDDAGHWLLAKLGGDERSRIQFILDAEIAYSSVANYSIGSHYAVQQTPYADRGLIETLASRPAMGSAAPSGSMLRMRLRDLRHRFLGEPEQLSFQRTLVRRIGGPVATVPINWGWRAAGGVSPGGMVLGALTLVGMAARSKGLDDGLLGKPIQWSGLPALHDFHDRRRWLRDDLRTYAQDLLGSTAVRDAGLFEPDTLARILREHFGGARDHYATVAFAMDIALAHKHFCRG